MLIFVYHQAHTFVEVQANKYIAIARYRKAICQRNLEYRYNRWHDYKFKRIPVAPTVLTLEEIKMVQHHFVSLFKLTLLLTP